MSGTSLDGIDVAIVDFGNFPPRIIHGHTTPYPDSLRQRLHDLCQSPSTTLDLLYGLDAELGELYAEAVNQALELASLDTAGVAALGCHGQTIRHSPDSAMPYTAQIGDPNRIATLTGITTVADFRRKDIALGGQAAPLAPAFHRFLFRSNDENRVLINIGGIANITYLPADTMQPVLGFDTGPGNTLLNYWNQKHQGSAFDDAGTWANSGVVIDSLLEKMISTEDYFRLDPPKSTGTEFFNPNWLLNFMDDKYKAKDVQATLVELTVVTIANAIARLPQGLESIYVCGGGVHNHYLLERLEDNLAQGRLATTEALGVDPDFVEAAAFAWLARERINLRPGNIPDVTRAQHAGILGGIYVSG
ncbi:MAG: anhydro-N-acetylmuramic acid kinase [Gammaproteobacteria bacterium]|nr:anhydro-N-acetylmuramic acid kinase [Gammaproteobacteria bacterium]